MESNALMHYGVLGMKWGVRRYQNKDGSLTPRGKKREEKNNERSKYAAKRILNEKIYYTDRELKRNEKQRVSLSKKIDNYESKANDAHDKGNFSKRDKYLDKYFDSFDKLSEYTKDFDKLVANSNFYKRKLSEIDSGALKAGKDYVARYTEAYNGAMYVKDAELKFLTEKGRR